MEKTNGVASEYKSEIPTSSFLKGTDFDSGLELEVVGMEKFTPENSDFGVKHQYGAGGKVIKENWFVNKGILKEGESFKYKFLVDGVEKSFDNSSLSFYFAFTKVDPEAGSKIHIKRNKITDTKVEWEITEI